MSEIPEWALERVCELTNADGSTYSPAHIRSGGYTATTSMGIAFARYIAEHEEPPVDPLAEAVEQVLAGFENRRHAQQYADAIRLKLAERGLKIVSEQS